MEIATKNLFRPNVNNKFSRKQKPWAALIMEICIIMYIIDENFCVHVYTVVYFYPVRT